MLIAEHFISSSIVKYGKKPITTNGDTWYPQACKHLGLKNHIHSPYQKSIIERTIKYLKDRTECFDDYFPCKRNKIFKLKAYP